MAKVDKNYFNNSKIANSLSVTPDLKNQMAIYEYGKNKQNIISYVDFKANDVELLNSSISRYEMAVMDAAYTLLANGKEEISPEMIANTMAGKEIKFNGNASSNIEKIRNAVEKLRWIEIKIDCTDIMRAKQLVDDTTTAVIRSRLLPITILNVKSKIKNIDKEIYHFDRKPVLYEYAEMLGRLICVPTEVLTIQGINETPEFIVLKQELIKVIEIIKNEHNNYNTDDIIYEWSHGSKTGGLFARIGIKREDFDTDKKWRDKKSKLHKHIMYILNDFVEKQYIEGYEVKKEKGTIVGVTIETK